MKKRSSKRSIRNRRIFWSVIVLAVILGGAGYFYYNKEQASKKVLVPLAATTISKGDIVLIATGPGKLVPSQEVSFGFKTSGQVTDVLAKLGDTVKAGQVLAHLENTTLDLKYKQAQANLEALSSPAGIATAAQAVQDAQANLFTATDTFQHYIGPDMLIAENSVTSAQQDVQVAQALAEKEPTAENKQNVVNTEAALKKAEDTLNIEIYNYASNYTIQTFTFPIRNSNGVTTSHQLFAPTDAQLASAQAAYELAKSNLSDAQNYLDVLNGVKTIDQVPASSVTQITEAQTVLDQAKADLDAAVLTAPISGTITSISLNAGNNADTSAVVTISNTSQPYLIDVNLDETDWDKAVIGNDASVTFDLLPNKSFPGKVTAVYPTLDTSSGASLVHIQVQLNSKLNTNIPNNATASVDVTGGSALGVVIVPISALNEVRPGQYAAYLMKNGKPVAQPVEIGLQSIVNAEVKSGLKPGDVVLTNAPVNN